MNASATALASCAALTGSSRDEMSRTWASRYAGLQRTPQPIDGTLDKLASAFLHPRQWCLLTLEVPQRAVP